MRYGLIIICDFRVVRRTDHADSKVRGPLQTRSRATPHLGSWLSARRAQKLGVRRRFLHGDRVVAPLAGDCESVPTHVGALRRQAFAGTCPGADTVVQCQAAAVDL